MRSVTGRPGVEPREGVPTRKRRVTQSASRMVALDRWFERHRLAFGPGLGGGRRHGPPAAFPARWQAVSLSSASLTTLATSAALERYQRQTCRTVTVPVYIVDVESGSAT